MASAIDRRFDILEKKASQQARAQTQDQQDALKRRFASLGATNTGAFVKQEQMAKERGAQRMQAAREGVEGQRLQAQQRQEEIQQQRQHEMTMQGRGFEHQTGMQERGFGFQAGESEKQRGFLTSERLGTQDFQSGEAEKQRGFVTSERLGSQDFQSGEADKQRGFITSEREAGQEYSTSERVASEEFQTEMTGIAQDFEKEMFNLNFDKVLGPQLDLAIKQFGMDSVVNYLNANIQMAEAMDQGLPGYEFNSETLPFIQDTIMGMNPNYNRPDLNITGPVQTQQANPYYFDPNLINISGVNINTPNIR